MQVEHLVDLVVVARVLPLADLVVVVLVLHSVVRVESRALQDFAMASDLDVFLDSDWAFA